MLLQSTTEAEKHRLDDVYSNSGATVLYVTALSTHEEEILRPWKTLAIWFQ